MAHTAGLMLTAVAAVTGTALWLAACGESSAPAQNETVELAASNSSPSVNSPDAWIQLDAATSGPAVNRLVLGSNVQWVDGGDNLLEAETLAFDPNMEALVISLAPSVLRYPGGAQSDQYDWTRGVGPLLARGSNPQAPTTRRQITFMGSGELMRLAAAVNAQALFTVNVLTGNAAEAASWVQHMNVTRLKNSAGGVLPKVLYWEIGNEPYYPNPDGTNARSCEIDPATYGARIDAFVKAMRAVDPGIKIGIALANDMVNGIQNVSPGCPHFTVTALNALTENVDFISLHDAYLPYDPSGRDHAAEEEYWAAMAGARSIQTDLAIMRKQLEGYPKLQSLPFAITEYNALFSLDRNSAFIHSMASPMAALYVADALRLLASDDEILMANIWSLSGNDHWGTIHSPTSTAGPYGRPAYEVLRLYSEALNGVRLTASVRSPTFDSSGLGFSAPASRLPTITTLATKTTVRGGATLCIVMINKDLTAKHIASVSLANATPTTAHLSLLTAANVFQSDDMRGAMQRTESQLTAAASMVVALPAHSVALLTLHLASMTP